MAFDGGVGFKFMDSQAALSLEIRKKKLSGLQKREALEKEVSMLQNMLNQEEKMHEILTQFQLQEDGSSISIPDFLPPKMKELLTELAMVESEIAHLETQISQLKHGLNQEHEVIITKEKTPSKQKNPIMQDQQENIVFETKALHFISKAIKGDYTLTDFMSLNETMGNSGALFQEKIPKKIGYFKGLDEQSPESGFKGINLPAEISILDQHGYLQYGLPDTSEDLLAMMNKATLDVGGNKISAQAMEHHILRKQSTGSKIQEGSDKEDDGEATIRKLYGLELTDRNVTFALCCGTRSSPAVRIYTGDGVSTELEKSKQEYLQASIMVSNTKKIAFPELLLNNMFDFAVDMNSLVQWVCQQLPTSGSLRKSMVDCYRNHNAGKTSSPISVEKIPYDFEFQYLLAM
ncbi:uncharacterized protein [Gossypium hirsutum]|uniref:Uncharacterized protein isoform X4 n=1 Tax=Gossypium hirsutum TaxID=3635 RepID=A0A1U8LQV5_GOSHI|nr:uncharacterized protein LOC107929697 isoform X4 [Gossypium hirsutum]